MDASLDKHSTLSRAKALLASGDDAALRYVCLELRFCLEAITYDKVSIYARRLPTEVLSTWQPPQLMKALVELEDHSDEDDNLYAARESSPGVRSGSYRMVGQHRSLKVKWLRSAYNALGSVLHVPHMNSSPNRRKYDADPAALRKGLTEIIERLEPVVESTVTATIARVIDFECALCRRQVVANADAIRKRRRVVCLHPDCQAEHQVSSDQDGTLHFTVDEPTYTCTTCQTVTPFPHRRHALGVQFGCPACGQKYEVVSNYAPVETEDDENEAREP